ncbi:MAG: hypothetical protein IID34_05595 [Planctomycetes bacterium]|nr:hypothetical protein [Planctomycetota bacterium]
MQNSRFHLIVLSSVIVALSAGQAMAQPSAAVCDDGGGPTLCVRFDNVADAPSELTDFEFDFSDANNPSVELFNGRDAGGTLFEWRVWSKDGAGAPANMGNVKAVGADDYDVKLLNDSGGAGAVNVGGINLNPSDAANFSNLSSATITGTLSGFTWLQRSSDGVGGNVTGPLTIDTISGFMIISGDVLAPMTVTTVSAPFPGVVIQGILGTSTQSADLDITTLAGPGPFIIVSDTGSATNYGDITVGNLTHILTVGGTVSSSSTVRIENMENAEAFGTLNLSTLAGTLELVNGIPSECDGMGECVLGTPHAAVKLVVITSTGVVDLNWADMAGLLTVVQAQNNSQIVDVGAVSGFLYPGFTQNGFFNGTLTVSSVSETSTFPGISTGEIEVFSGAALNGTITVTGVNAGVVEASAAFTGLIDVGSVAASGVIETGQAALGNIVVNGVCEGAIEIGGDLTGTVDINGALTSTGSITVDATLGEGGLIVVGGLTEGAIRIGEKTADLSSIHLSGGLDLGGTVEINTSKSAFNAEGVINVGSAGCFLNPPDITFDG